jgi:hypothetical protein
MEEIRDLQRDIDVLLEQEEVKWRQRAREDWLQHGDKNTKYFHACANQRSKVNKITSIVNEDGLLCSTQDEVVEAFIRYFNSIFSSSAPSGIRECLAPVEQKVSLEMNNNLTREVTSEEIAVALHHMAPLKAPGPDGFSASFFQEHWDLVGPEVCLAIKIFFTQAGWMLL